MRCGVKPPVLSLDVLGGDGWEAGGADPEDRVVREDPHRRIPHFKAIHVPLHVEDAEEASLPSRLSSEQGAASQKGHQKQHEALPRPPEGQDHGSPPNRRPRRPGRGLLAWRRRPRPRKAWPATGDAPQAEEVAEPNNAGEHEKGTHPVGVRRETGRPADVQSEGLVEHIHRDGDRAHHQGGKEGSAKKDGIASDAAANQQTASTQDQKAQGEEKPSSRRFTKNGTQGGHSREGDERSRQSPPGIFSFPLRFADQERRYQHRKGCSQSSSPQGDADGEDDGGQFPT